MTTKIGCFGSVLYHDPTGKRCSSCRLLAECAAEVAVNQKKLQEWYDALRADATTSKSAKRIGARGLSAIEGPTVTPRVEATVTATQPLIATGKTLNKKPREFVERWMAKGVQFDAYKADINPFATCGNKFATTAMAYLMEKQSVTKNDMIDHLVATLGWGLGTASSHASIVFDAFEYLGIIVVTGSALEMVATLRK